MRYIIHSEDCVFDATTGTHSIVVDRRIPNPVSLKILSLLYEAPTLSAYPLCVNFKSDAFQDMMREKHSVRLVANNHENETSIIAVLGEDTTAGRYTLIRPVRLALNPHSYIRSFDFAFADNNTVIGLVTANSFDQTIDNFDLPTAQEKTGKIFRSFDTGGVGGNYGVNETLNRIYISESGVNWKFEVLAFASESGFDKLTVKEVDSGGAESTLLDEHSGLSLPAQVVWTATATQPKIKFYWNSDSSNQNIGFDIIIWEDNGGVNTLSEVDDIYKITIPAISQPCKFQLEMDLTSASL